MKKVFCTFLIILFSLQSSHALVHDPNNLLSQADEILGHIAFTESFQANDEARIRFSDCGFMGCGAPVETIFRIENNNNEIAIIGLDSQGKIHSRQVVTEKEWNEKNQNFIRYKIAFMESFGFELNADQLNKISCPNSLTEQPCYQLLLSGANQANIKTKLTITFAKSSTALGQILIYQQKDDGLIKRTIEQTLLSIKRLWWNW